jgi:HSP20 family protein
MPKETPTKPNENQMENEKNRKGKTDTARSTPSMRDDADGIFDDRFWLEPFDFFRNLPRLPDQLRRSMFPRVDVSETDKDVKVIADIPGVDPDNMYIDVRNNRMILRGRVEREEETDESARPYKYERMYGEFRREFPLPAPVNEGEVRAVYKNGILTITVPKSENVGKSRVKIERI